MDDEKKALLKKIDNAFLKMTLNLIENAGSGDKVQTPELAREARECLKFIHESLHYFKP